jgi:hypothetical protein
LTRRAVSGNIPEKDRKAGGFMRRFEIMLPEDHPLWQIPPRLRAQAARRWLALGAEAEAAERGLEARLAALEARVAVLEAAARGEAREEPKAGIDPKAFLAAFD